MHIYNFLKKYYKILYKKIIAFITFGLNLGITHKNSDYSGKRNLYFKFSLLCLTYVIYCLVYSIK